MRNRRRNLVFGAITFALLAGLFLVNWLGGGMLFGLMANAVTSRTLSCAELPTTVEAEMVVDRQAALFDRIQAVNPDFVSVHVTSEEACPGRVTLTIAYATEGDRKSIEAILSRSGDTSRSALWQPPRLFGIPYRLVNT